MTVKAATLAAAVAAVAAAPAGRQPAEPGAPATERRLDKVRQLTSGGENAESYFSPDGRRLIFQASPAGRGCDQIYIVNVNDSTDSTGSSRTRVSTGTGRTTCGYFYPNGREILFASTHGASPDCPPRPGYERGYVWPVYTTYDIYRGRLDGSGLTRLTDTPGYDAEATIAPDGRIVFTSTRDGDMEIYSMNADGSDVRRLTRRPGPDGGPFFSFDGRQIVFRGRELGEGPERDDYTALLKEALWRPTQLEIFVMDRDGGNIRQLTRLGGANFAPSWHPNGRRIIFSSNHHNPKGRNFDLFLINLDGTGLEQVTFNPTFDGFPMFSPDGRQLAFSSNRRAKAEGETNVFVADWIEPR